MVLNLSFPARRGDVGQRDHYVVHPTFRVPMAAGTLFIFSPLDDLHFCHEAEFDQEVLRAAGAAGHRFALVYRWLTSEREFYTAPEKRWGMKLTETLQAKQVDRQISKARKRKADLDRACRIP